MGLVALAKPDLSEAARLFCQAAQVRPDLGAEDAIGYVKSLAGGTFEPSAEHTYDESMQAMRALALMKAGSWADAEAIWEACQRPQM